MPWEFKHTSEGLKRIKKECSNKVIADITCPSCTLFFYLFLGCMLAAQGGEKMVNSKPCQLEPLHEQQM
jgi:hypothetical protein